MVDLAPLEEDLRLQILKSRYQTLAEQHQGFAVPAPVLEFLARSVGQSGPRPRRRASTSCSPSTSSPANR